MAGKRPDQYQIDGGEAGSTDYKRLRQDEGIKEQEKHKLAQQKPDRSLIPESGENPARAELREAKAARKAEQGGARGDGGDESRQSSRGGTIREPQGEESNQAKRSGRNSGEQNPTERRIDAMVEQTFPASDPLPPPSTLSPRGDEEEERRR